MPFFDIGYDNYPTNRGYPTLDKFTLEDEREYLRGWHRKKAELETETEEPTGSCWMEDY